MNPVRLQSHSWALLVAAAVVLGGCEGRDEALQKELSELREAARIAKEEAEAAKARLSKVELLSPEVLKASLEAGLGHLKNDLLASFPGYRVGAVEPGEIFYVFGDVPTPYRSRLKVQMTPGEPSVLTPEVPVLSVLVCADPAGKWVFPEQSKLREIQVEAAAAAIARASAPRQQQQPSRQDPPRQQQPAAPPPDPNARVISWGGSQPTAQAPTAQAPTAQVPTAQAPAAPAETPRRPTQNLPKADQSYEIRFE